MPNVMTGGRKRASLRAVLVMVATLLAVATGCTANPPPPIESTDSPKTQPAKPGKNSVVVAVDDIGIGFNPHLRSQQSPATAAVASMVLPSPFKAAPTPGVPGGTDWNLNPALMVSADVSAQDPFTITYQIKNEASWSDGAPIAAEDFKYLWQQMITQPGTVDPAGYRLISDVSSSAGGKTVTVTLTQPYPAWRQLFTDLLPQHLVKDSGFEQGLVDTIRISGGQFRIKQADRGREEILLERNDRYWGQPAVPDQILLRRGGTPAQVAESLRVGDAQMALVHGGVALQAQLAAIPSVRTAVMAQSREMSLVLNGRGGDLADVRVRRAVLALLDPVLLATVGAQTGSWVEPVRAQVLSPSDPGYAATQPPRMPQEEAFGLLAEAGFARAAETPAVPSATSPAPQPRPLAKNGKSLTVRLGAVDGDTTTLAVANTAADQLRSAGIDVIVRSVTAAQLYGKELTEAGIDAVVGWERTGEDPATVLASRYGCAPVAPPGDNGDTTVADGAKKSPSNLSGVCDPGLQPGIDAALRGIDPGKVIAETEPRLWELATVLPIVQDTQVAAAGPRVDGASLSGAIQTGIFADAANWRRLP
ncbi:ABC transporter family substrate-binding protein [Nocardia tengchongensis]